MNIFAVHKCPVRSAQSLPDKHVTKMPVETCQILACVFDQHNWGSLTKKDGSKYTVKSSIKNHPCTRWAACNKDNLAWLIQHGYSLCAEYTHRYGKRHACQDVIEHCVVVYEQQTNKDVRHAALKVTENPRFIKAMPDEIKHKHKNDIHAYREYVKSKPWAPFNYLRDPSRKPLWMHVT